MPEFVLTGNFLFGQLKLRQHLICRKHFVVYSDLRLGAANFNRWLKYVFQQFLHKNKKIKKFDVQLSKKQFF